MSEDKMLLMPHPKKITLTGKRLTLLDSSYEIVVMGEPHHISVSVAKLKNALDKTCCVHSASGNGKPVVFRLILESHRQANQEYYSLSIQTQEVEIKASSDSGLYYGVCTICQLLSQFGNELPTMVVEDWPDYPVRGVLLDISRDKVMTMDTLFSLVEELSEWKINHLQLYVEHTFAYSAHPIVWSEASPMTAEELRQLDAFCRERYIELTPYQASFGHMDRWLKHDCYKHLAEAPDGFDFPWGHSDSPFSLCPIDEQSIDFIRGLYDELLPNFRSDLFNVGCDETFDLGQGRSKVVCERKGTGQVYLDFILAINKEVTERNHRMLFWSDIILQYPELISSIPRDVIALQWGYEAEHPFEADGRKLADSRIPFWVCPGTSSWSSITGRTDNCIANLKNAAVNGLASGASGFLNTDWGDNGHWNYLPISYLGLFAGAALSWNSSQDITDMLPEALSLHVFKDPSGTAGRVAFGLGNTYKQISKRLGNSTVIWKQITSPLDDIKPVEGVTADEFNQAKAYANELLDRFDHCNMNRPDASVICGEFANAVSLSNLACDLGVTRLNADRCTNTYASLIPFQSQIRQILTEHERLWLARNRPGGLKDSKKLLDKHQVDEKQISQV